MSGPVRRRLRVAVFSLVLVPVCVVLAGEGGVSWRVKIPAIQPVERWADKAGTGPAIFVADLKRPVADATLKGEPFEPLAQQTDGGNEFRASVSDKIVSRRKVTSVAVVDGSAEAGQGAVAVVSPQSIAPVTVKSEMVVAAPVIVAAAEPEIKASRAEVKHAEQDIRQVTEAPSVSLVPSENARVKAAKASGDDSFFTTPK
ncbi:MAG TPA: hypothetical protein DCS48_05185, partial [Desulfovibrio sp.]|nr:hypothetical protein [Desulfovibrio sp.]